VLSILFLIQLHYSGVTGLSGETEPLGESDLIGGSDLCGQLNKSGKIDLSMVPGETEPGLGETHL